MKRRICDIHSHIAPGVDDGSQNLRMSVEMARDAYRQGVHNIVCSSHSYGDVDTYYASVKLFKEQLKAENIPINVYTGFEIYCGMEFVDEIIKELNNHQLPTINNTKYVLIEFSPYEIATHIMYCVQQLHKNGYKVILAHVERYVSLFENQIWIAMLNHLGVRFQINAYSLHNESNVQTKHHARKLLMDGRVSFVGSDAHRTDHRPYAMLDGINYIYQHCDIEYANNICYKNAERLLNMN